MGEQVQDADQSGREQRLLERQRALEGAVLQWEDDLIAEGHTKNKGENERNIRALKARRVALLEESRGVSQELKAIRLAHTQGHVRVANWWRRWN